MTITHESYGHVTVLTLLPIACVFMFLQKYIATGIASTGGK